MQSNVAGSVMRHNNFFRRLKWIAVGISVFAILGIVSPRFSSIKNYYISLNSPINQTVTPYRQSDPSSAVNLSTVLDPSRYGTGIQRSLQLLRTSTPEHPHTLRILFYGQSITKQGWWISFTQQLRQKFPSVNLIVENRAIGGFDTTKTVRTAEHDVYPFYPDLTIFHNYGPEPEYETIIANIRQRTTSEILLLSDHIEWMPPADNAAPANQQGANPEDLKVYNWKNSHVQWLNQLAKKYSCELVDIRTAWHHHLAAEKLAPQAFLRDAIHLNKVGEDLMRDLVFAHVINSPNQPRSPEAQLVKDYSDLRWQQDQLTFEFEGNRVDVVDSGKSKASATSASPSPQPSGVAQVWIDGQPVSQLPELYSISRPSNAIRVDMPALLRVTAKKPLLLEDWSVIINEINPEGSQFKFEVWGTKTGFDGSGDSRQTFVSQSGRVVIEPGDWNIEETQRFTKEPTPSGYQINWSVKPLFTEFYQTSVSRQPTGEPDVLVKGLTNGKHRLELRSLTGKPLPIKALRVYQPVSPA
jgi:hypothetical protein